MLNLSSTTALTDFTPKTEAKRRLLLTPLDEPGHFLLVLDNSSLEKFTTCPKSAEYYLVAEREAQARNSALVFGGAIHAGLEKYLEWQWYMTQEPCKSASAETRIDYEQEMTQAKAALAAVPGLRERLTNNKLTQNDIQTLGLTAGQKLYNTNLQNYIGAQSENQNPTTANVATPEELARYNALSQLGGVSGQNIFGGATQAGGFKPYEFNSNQLQQDITNKQKSVEDLLGQSSKNAKTLQDMWKANQPYVNAGGSIYDYLNTVNPDAIKNLQNIQNAPSLDYLNELMKNSAAHKGLGGNYSSYDNFLGGYNNPFGQLQENLRQITPYDPYRTLQVATPDQEENTLGNTFNVT